MQKNASVVLESWDALPVLSSRFPGVAGDGGIWVRVWMDRLDPTQRAGWKIHVSAIPSTLPEMIARALPTLDRLGLPFKVIRTPADLERMNDGRFGLTQIGKAMTLYPPNEAEALHAAQALQEALHGLPGPHIPSDRAFHDGAPVYFRFGPYDGRMQIDALGRARRILAHPEHGDVIDDTDGGEVPPPSPALLPQSPPYDHLAFLRDRLFIVQVLQLSAKGGAFLAVENTPPVRDALFLKTAKAFTHSDLFGRDALWAIRREHAFLERLAGLPGIPPAGELLSGDGVVALLRPYIEGERWWDLWTRPDARAPHTRELLRHALESLWRVVQACHERGVLIRDLSPGNILLAGDGPFLLDFELAHDAASSEPPYRRGTLGFYDPARTRFAPPGPSCDHYALLALALMAHTGIHPAWFPEGLVHAPIPLAGAFPTAWRHTWDTRSRAETFAPAFETLLDSMKTPHQPDASPPGPLDPEALWANVHARFVRFREEDRSVDGLNVYSGVSGLILAGAEQNPGRLSMLFTEAHWKALAAEMIERAQALLHIPGLYFGASGVAAALWNLAHAREDALLRDDALGLFRQVEEHATDSLVPDLCQGWAGYAAAWLAVHTLAPASESRAPLQRAAERLLALAQRTPEGGLLWPWPEGPYGSMSGARSLGFAHGVAGIVHTLLRLYTVLDDPALLDAAEGGLRTLRQTVRLQDGFAWWPPSVDDDTVWNAWCHGTPGIVKTFVQALAVREHPEDRALLRAALHGIAAANNSGWCLCHGVASRLDAYTDARSVTGTAWTEFQPAADQDAAVLAALDLNLLEESQRNGEAGAEAGGLMTGAAGVLRALSRYTRIDTPVRGLLP